VRIIVSDTSPIRALNHLGLLDLLPKLFKEILIPPGVLQELQSQPRRFSPVMLSGLGWLRVQAPANQTKVQDLLKELDLGEAEAIALAIELHAEILMDEAEGREIAARLGLSLVGLLGLLLRFKSNRFIPAVMPLIDQLQSGLRFFISDQVRAEIKRLSGE